MTTSTPTVFPPKSAWASDWQDALMAGAAAVSDLTVTPMTVVGRDGCYHVEGGVCGFARVEVRPRTSAWAKWLKRHGWYSSDYHRCVYMNVSDYGQSMQRKEAFAMAVAGFLTAKGYPGVDWTATID